MVNYYIQFWKRAFDFKGVASRPQYWWPVITNFILLTIIGLIMLLIDGIIGFSLGLVDLSYSMGTLYNMVLGFISLFLIIPSISLTVRRLHDHNFSGWLYLISFIPFGGLVIFVFTCMSTVKENNRWRMYDIQRGYIRDEFMFNLSGYRYH
jgi:uncharacterized membrane protein YhaH (DUF805 family)